MDAMRRAKKMFKDEHKVRPFAQEPSWETLRIFPKWDAPNPVPIPTVNVEGTSGGNARGTAELFGEDRRPRPREHVRQKNQIRELIRCRGESNDNVCGYNV
nr:hypothetical protein [Tanacetum cinerariifolium]